MRRICQQRLSSSRPAQPEQSASLYLPRYPAFKAIRERCAGYSLSSRPNTMATSVLSVPVYTVYERGTSKYESLPAASKNCDTRLLIIQCSFSLLCDSPQESKWGLLDNLEVQCYIFKVLSALNGQYSPQIRSPQAAAAPASSSAPPRHYTYGKPVILCYDFHSLYEICK